MKSVMKSIQIFDSMRREKNNFEPIGKKVLIYVCGMTVYDLCHIGHARVIIFFDFVRRYLEAAGYDVKYVRNITDIDDKIIKKSQENGKSCSEITEKYIDAMHDDEASLGNISPHFEPRATEYVQEMIEMINTLINNGLAYVSSSGDVCYSVNNFLGYGNLARRDLDSLISGHRVSQDDGKNNPLDFVLWKLAKVGEPSWESPWGLGRPGWHIECSAMATSILGETIDIHGGGVDLQFPHHENEIAQSEGATGKKFVKNWMHVGSVQINNEKMSKSLGNFFTIKEILSEYHPETIRLFMLSSHYRHPIQFTKEKLHQAERNIERMYLALRPFGDNLSPNDSSSSFVDFMLALADDFNTPKALSIMAEQVKRINLASAAEKEDAAGSLLAMGKVLGLVQQSIGSYFKTTSDDNGLIEELVRERTEARACKDWKKADYIRDKLLSEYSVEVEDTASGAIWRKI
jgi:cysteinyl-tRNA synthetase